MERLHYRYEMEDLRSIPLFANCSETELMELLGHPHKRHIYRLGDVIMARNDRCQSLLLLISGKVSLHVAGGNGKCLVVKRITSPQILNLSCLLNSNQKVTVDCVADDECCVLSISRQGFMSLLMLNSNVSICVARMVADQNRFLVGKIKTLATENLEERVVEYLKSDGAIRNIRAVADMLGVARPSLSRTVNAMIRNGLLKRVDGKAVILAKWL